MKKTISLSIEREIIEAVKRIAADERRSLSQMIEIILEEALEKRKEND